MLSPVKSSREEGETIKVKISSVVPEPGAPQHQRGAGRSCPWPRRGQAPGAPTRRAGGSPGASLRAENPGAGFAGPRARGGRGARGTRHRAGPPGVLESPREVAGALLAVRGGTGAWDAWRRTGHEQTDGGTATGDRGRRKGRGTKGTRRGTDGRADRRAGCAATRGPGHAGRRAGRWPSAPGHGQTGPTRAGRDGPRPLRLPEAARSPRSCRR